jgi:hypothetical protein
MYGPLQPQEIRLLKFLPTGPDDDEIRCCLAVHPFNQAPPYVALSYVWGNPKVTYLITLEKSQFQVRSNLKAALKRLRDWDSKENYWIDALCINQSNLDERNDQVRLMGKIYSQCKFVFIWLGKESSDSDRALSLVRKWGDLDRLMDIIKPYESEGVVAEDICERTVQTVGNVLRCSPSTLVRVLDSLIIEQPSFEAVIRLLKRPYWQRIWILQEIILSRKAIVFCGNSHVEWQYFKLFHLITSGVLLAQVALLRLDPDEIRSYTDDRRPFFESTKARTLLWLLGKRLSIFTTAKIEQGITDLEWRLFQTANYQATDPRDKLYALLGLDTQRSIPIQPNYKRSLRQVYADFVSGALCIDKLRLCGTNGVGYKKQESSTKERIPSWVPDLRTFHYLEEADVNTNFDELAEFGGCESMERLRRTGRCKVHAAGFSKPIVNICNDSLLLTAKGVAIDHIEAFELPKYSLDPTADAVASQIRWHKLVRDHCNVPHPTGLPRIQAYFRTLVLDSESNLSEIAAGFLASFEFIGLDQSLLKVAEASGLLDSQNGIVQSKKGLAWLLRFNHILQFLSDTKLKWLLHFLIVSGEIDSIIDICGNDERGGLFPPLSTRMLLQGFYGPLDTTPNSDLTYLATEDNREKYKVQYIRAIINTHGRCLFVTPRGYIGIGPPEVQKGDQICVLLGCDIPLIIRPVAGHYIVVGDCFVYGIMKGEVMKDVEESRLKLESFVFN